MTSCSEYQADLGLTLTNPLFLRTGILYLTHSHAGRGIVSFYLLILSHIKILLAYRQGSLSRFMSLWPYLLKCTSCMVSLSGTPGSWIPPSLGIRFSVGTFAWIQLQSHFTFHRLRIIAVLNTCFFMAAYCSGSFRHFIWDNEDNDIIMSSWTSLA